MASELPPPTPTTITCLSDDLLREIFLRLPALPSLVCAAFTCRAFRRAVRSSRAFRRSFRALHAPPLLALFFEVDVKFVPVFPLPCPRSDPDFMASDFSDIRLPRHGDAYATERVIQSGNPRADDYATLDKVSGGTKLKNAFYSSLTQDLELRISRQYEPGCIHLNFYTLSSEDGQGPSHVVCHREEDQLTENTAFVFSSDTMEWQISRKATLVLGESEKLTIPTVVRGLLCWRRWMHDQIVLFDTATCHFSLIDLPTPLKTVSTSEKKKMEFDSTYKLGETKDGKLCIVDILDNTLVSLFMIASNDSVVGRWMLYKEFSLHPIVMEFTGCLIEEDGPFDMEPVAVISDYVYLSIFYSKGIRQTCHLYLSVCLETSEMSELFRFPDEYTIVGDPYLMAWPPSLVQSKEESESFFDGEEESETDFTGDSIEGGRPVYTEEASTLLVTALQSFSQALMMNDGDSNKEILAELDAFLGPTEGEEGSLISQMPTLDAELRTVRDRILRIRT